MRILTLVLALFLFTPLARAEEAEKPEQLKPFWSITAYGEANAVFAERLEFPPDAAIGVGLTIPLRRGVEFYVELGASLPFVLAFDPSPRITLGPNVQIGGPLALAFTLMYQMNPPYQRSLDHVVALAVQPSLELIEDRLYVGIVFGVGVEMGERMKLEGTLAPTVTLIL